MIRCPMFQIFLLTPSSVNDQKNDVWETVLSIMERIMYSFSKVIYDVITRGRLTRRRKVAIKMISATNFEVTDCPMNF